MWHNEYHVTGLTLRSQMHANLKKSEYSKANRIAERAWICIEDDIIEIDVVSFISKIINI